MQASVRGTQCQLTPVLRVIVKQFIITIDRIWMVSSISCSHAAATTGGLTNDARLTTLQAQAER